MKEEFESMETRLRELDALKRYEDFKALNGETSELKRALAETQAERDRLKGVLTAKQNAEEEACQLRQVLKETRQELAVLNEAKAVVQGKELTLKDAAQEFLKTKEAEIKVRVEKELRQLQDKFDLKLPELVYDSLIAILKRTDWPADIAEVIDRKAEEKALAQMDAEFQKRINATAANRLEELKRTEWHPFLKGYASVLSSSLKSLANELQGTWQFVCDKCQTEVTVNVGAGEIGRLLAGEHLARCSHCTDFALPPEPPITPHKILGSALEDLMKAYLASKEPPK